MEISLCMIVRDEEECLSRALESVQGIVDEIIVLDTGSTDKTKDIARAHGAAVFEYEWQDDFAAARNAAFSYASKPYLMWMDADDVLEESGREKLIALHPALDGSVDAVMMPYACGHRADGAPELVFDRERIVRAGAGFFFEGNVHEAMSVSGSVIREDIVIRHQGDHAQRSNRRNLLIYEKWIKSEKPMTPRDWHYYARELMQDQRFEEAQKVFSKVLEMNCYKQLRLDTLLQRAHCLLQLDRTGEARAQLLCAMAVDTPRADVLCAMGLCEMQEGRNASAAFWYRSARICEPPKGTGAFVRQDDYDYIPSMQLCVLLDKMGRLREAAQENEHALIARPGDRAALANRAYFASRLKAAEA